MIKGCMGCILCAILLLVGSGVLLAPFNLETTARITATNTSIRQVAMQKMAVNDPSTTKRCYIVATQLFGDHDPVLALKTWNWWQDVNVKSIVKAGETLPQGSTVDIVLQLGGVYLLNNKTLPFRPLPTIQHTNIHLHWEAHTHGLTSAKATDIVRDRNCSILSLVRLDADDALSANFFDSLARSLPDEDKELPNMTAYVFGTPVAEPIVLLKKPMLVPNTNTTSEQLMCGKGNRHEHINSTVTMSNGQTITMDVALWHQHVPGLIRGGNHMKTVATLQSKIPGLTVVPTRVSEEVSLYLVTPLSGHFFRYEHFLRDSCTLADLEAIIMEAGGVPSDAKLLWDARHNVPSKLSVTLQKGNAFYNKLHEK